MSVRENIHQLVDTLPDDTDEISAETQAAIDEGLDDIRNSRTITLDEYRQTRGQ